MSKGRRRGALLVLILAATACAEEAPTKALVTIVAPRELPVTAVATQGAAADPTQTPTATPVQRGPGEPNYMGKYPAAFENATDEAGAGFQHHVHPDEMVGVGGGAAVLDFNGDGLDDIYAVDSFGPNALYRNNGDGTFTDLAVAAGVDDPESRGSGACAADYDNDGDQDLFATSYGGSKLYLNRGDGTFVDVASAAGVSDPDETYRSTGCAWGDYDRDGHLDLVVVRHLHEWSPFMLDRGDFYAGSRRLSLFHNDGSGAFSDVAALLGGVEKPNTLGQYGPIWGAGYQPGWADLDNDGDPDLYIVNDFGVWVNGNVLLRNDGPGEDGSWIFTDVSIQSGTDVKMDGMALAVGDYDLDGFLDMFVTNIGDNVLLRNSGSGLAFTDVATETGTAVGVLSGEDRVSWGAVFFDYDNDTDEDLYIVSGYLPPRALEVQPNVLLRNDRDGAFTDVSFGSGADNRDYGRGGVYLDFDRDGCLDLYVLNYGQAARLYRNLCDWGNNWLVIDPEGSAGNRDGIGARITVVTGGEAQIREVRGGSSQMGQSTMPPHFGLGTAAVADLVVVRWPSGAVQTLSDVAANQRVVVREPR